MHLLKKIINNFTFYIYFILHPSSIQIFYLFIYDSQNVNVSEEHRPLLLLHDISQWKK